jgi:hypothetical protein
VPPFQFFSQLADFHERWYQRYAIGSHLNVEFSISYKRNNNMTDARTCEVDVTIAALHLGS